jgi:hypothetical protein
MGGSGAPLLPCHTSGHAGPHPAVRKVEVLVGKSGYSNPVVVADGETELHKPHGIAPQTPPIGSRLGRGRRWYSEFALFPKGRGAALPLLELQRSQAVTNPLVVVDEDSRRIRQPEVPLPFQPGP